MVFPRIYPSQNICGDWIMAEWKKKLEDKGHVRLYVNIPESTREMLALYKAKSRKTIERIVKDSIEFYIFAKQQQEKGIKK